MLSVALAFVLSQASPPELLPTKDFEVVHARLASSLKRSLKVTAKERRVLPKSPVATRAMVVASLEQLYLAAQPKFKQPAKKVTLPAGFKVASMQSKALEGFLQKLVVEGFIPRSSFLVYGINDKISITQVGEAYGKFLIELAERTHTKKEGY